MLKDTKRGTGRTTQQIKNAPENSFFVWCNSRLYYPQKLALHLGRRDVKIVSPGYLEDFNLRGHSRPIVIDHATALSSRQWDAVEEYRFRLSCITGERR